MIMDGYKGKNSLRRKEAVGMDEFVGQFIRDMKLSSGINRQRAVEAWNSVSGASRYTLDVKFEKGVMTCVIASSVVRNQLYLQRDVLVARLDEYLRNDELFIRENSGEGIVRNLILR